MVMLKLKNKYQKLYLFISLAKDKRLLTF